MKKILISVITFFAIAINATATENIQASIDKFVADSTLRYASVGVCVYDMQKKAEIGGFRSLTADIPASTMKTLTCATAIAKLGPDFRFNTIVKMHGEKNKKGKFKGKLIVIGGGDPTLGSKFFPDSAAFISMLCGMLRQQGIKQIEGEIEIVTSSAGNSYNLNWGLDDVAFSYGAGAYLFNYADNSIRIPVTVDQDAIIYDEEYVSSHDMVIKDEIERHDINSGKEISGITLIRGIGSNVLVLSGNTNDLNKEMRFNCSVANPGARFESELLKKFKDYGIKFKYKKLKSNKIKGSEKVLLEYKSPALADIAASALERSDNMYTECILRSIGLTEHNVWDGELSVKITKEFWDSKGLDISQLFMYDGSGLARRNKVTAGFMSRMLAEAYLSRLSQDVNYSTLFPVAGVNGTVRSLLKGTPYAGTYAVKSGSMGDVQCYAGYYPLINPRYAITVMVNNYHNSYSGMRKRIGDMLLELFPALEQYERENVEIEEYKTILKNSKILNRKD